MGEPDRDDMLRWVREAGSQAELTVAFSKILLFLPIKAAMEFAAIIGVEGASEQIERNARRLGRPNEADVDDDDDEEDDG